MGTWLLSAIDFVGTTYQLESAFVAITTAVLVFPIFRYVHAGWKYKSEDITNSIEAPAKRIYLDKFQKVAANNEADANQLFYKMYHRRFGKRHFTVPIGL